MNTIRQPRRRPRVKSVSWRTLGWLIRREAAWCILNHEPMGNRRSPACIRFLRYDNRQIQARVNRTLLYLPERENYP